MGNIFQKIKSSFPFPSSHYENNPVSGMMTRPVALFPSKLTYVSINSSGESMIRSYSGRELSFHILSWILLHFLPSESFQIKLASAFERRLLKIWSFQNESKKKLSLPSCLSLSPYLPKFPRQEFKSILSLGRDFSSINIFAIGRLLPPII